MVHRQIQIQLHSPKDQPIKMEKQNRLTMPKYHKRVLVFDTETSGLMPKRPRKGEAFPPNESYPYIMQLSYIVYNVLTNKIEEIVDEYVRIPDTVQVSPESVKVHGITREITEQKGKSIVQLLAKFFVAYMKCDCIVAHNLQFDSELVRKEMWRNRAGLEKFVTNQERVNMMCGIFTKKFNAAYHIDTFCTMMNTIELCNIDFPVVQPTTTQKELDHLDGTIPENVAPKNTNVAVNVRKKFPRLNELYAKLFSETESAIPVDLHNSIIDVLVCLRCFLKVRGAMEMSESDFRDLVQKYSRLSL